jgi:hypothetical protein
MHFPSMRISGAAAAALLLVCTVARADDLDFQTNAPSDRGPTLGVGMICNTAEQAAQFLKLRAQGDEPERAMAAVNAQARDPRACGIAAVAYIADQTMGTQAVNNKLLQVVRINVVAGYDRTGWHRIAGAVQYAVVEQKGYGI